MDNKSATTTGEASSPAVIEATKHPREVSKEAFSLIFSMENKSATTSEAAPALIEATTHLKEVKREPKDDLEKHKRDVSEKKVSDVIEILQGLVSRLQKMEEKMDSRFQQMEEKVECRLQQIEGKVDLLISSIKAEADNMSVDGSYSDDEEPAKKKPTYTPQEEVAPNPFKPLFAEKESDSSVKPFTFNNGGARSIFGYGGSRAEESSRTLFGKKESDSSFSPFGGDVPSLFVGGRFSGGRCGGQGVCSFC